MSEAFLNSPAMNIPAEYLASAEYVENVGAVETTFQKIYTAFKNKKTARLKGRINKCSFETQKPL